MIRLLFSFKKSFGSESSGRFVTIMYATTIKMNPTTHPITEL